MTDACVSHITRLLRAADSFMESQEGQRLANVDARLGLAPTGEAVQDLLSCLHHLLQCIIEQELLDRPQTLRLFCDLGLPVSEWSADAGSVVQSQPQPQPPPQEGSEEMATPPPPWPLHISPFSLSFFGQQCLFWLQQERTLAKQLQASGGSSESPDASWATDLQARVLRRWLNALNRRCFEAQSTGPIFNLTDAQVFLMLFHTLRGTFQKKALFSQLCQIIGRLAEQCGGVADELNAVAVSRVLLLLDYMLHHFFEPPERLFPDVQPFLFAPSSAARAANLTPYIYPPPGPDLGGSGARGQPKEMPSLAACQLFRLTDRPSDTPGKEDRIVSDRRRKI